MRQNSNSSTNSNVSTMSLSSAEAGTKLRHASDKGRLKDVRALLASGAAITKDSVRTLHLFNRLVRSAFIYTRLPFAHQQNGLSALHKAARKGHTGVVRVLLSSGKFKLNSGDKVRNTTARRECLVIDTLLCD